MIRRTLLTVVATALVVASAGSANAAPIIVLVGDDDGFGGTQGANSNPGDPYANFASPSIAPGTYTATTGMDATTEFPWSPYVFEFVFLYDASSFSSITAATLSIQSGSLARRLDGSGFGFATVTADGGSGVVGLGDFWDVSTGAVASPLEESVKERLFDVSSLVVAGLGSLTIRVDGSGLVAPVDQFAVDFARLTIDGRTAAVPEPTGVLLVGIGLIAFLARR